MDIGLFQKQTTNLVMTTKLSQAIALLEYTTIELAEFIQEQALENPLIELEEKKQDMDIDTKYEMTNKTLSSRNTVNALDFIVNDKKHLSEILLEQVKWLDITIDYNVLKFLILSLDDNGYLTITCSDAAQHLSVNIATVKENLTILQSLDPVGVGARDLNECLLLQLRAYYPGQKVAIKILTDYFNLFINKKWRELARKLKISLDQTKKAISYIQNLNPKPCSNLTDDATIYFIPDLTITKENMNYTISLNDHILPNIHVNKHYKELLEGKSDTSKYMREKFQDYTWLIRSIEQRQHTLLKIAKVIVNRQAEFLVHGFYRLKPLTLKEVADEIAMHESSVSRAIKNKVIQTPIGTFQMKQLFTSKLENEDGSHISSAKVKVLIKTIIYEEDKQKPLSDQKIANHLDAHYNITVSRRTIAKYREELNLLPSNKRKTIDF